MSNPVPNPIQIPNSLGTLLPVEQLLWSDLLAIAQSSDCKIRAAAIAGDRSVRAAFLRWYLIAAIPSSTPSPTSLEIVGAEITGEFNLQGLVTGLLLRFIDCTFSGPVLLSDSTVGGFEMLDGQAGEITGDRLIVNGPMKFCSKDLRAPAGPKIKKIRINGAEVRGNLDMRGCTLEPVREKERETIALFADGLTVHGNLLLSDKFEASGEIRLNGCTIDRNLDCSMASLKNHDGYSLSAAGAHIKGTVYLTETRPWNVKPGHEPFVSEGMVRLEGATIDGELDCSGGVFRATAFLPARIASGFKPPEKNLRAILANGLRVGSDVKFCQGKLRFSSHGSVRLISASIGGDFICETAVFDFPGETPLIADGILVSGVSFLNAIDSNGMLRFVQANLNQGLYLDNASFDTTGTYRDWTEKDEESDGPTCGLDLSYAEIGKTLLWEKVSRKGDGGQIRFCLHMPGAKIDTLDDDELSWRALNRFDLTNCEFGAISKLNNKELGWRLALLDREYAPSDLLRLRPDEARLRFKPQPYLHLAKLFRAAGYESSGKTAMVRLERNKTRFGDMPTYRKAWQWTLDALLRYGYSPFRPVLVLGAWAIVCSCVFASAYNAGHFIQAKDNQLAEPTKENPKSPPRVVFRAPVYAVDTLVPIVDLQQKKNWLVKTPNWWLEALLIFNTFFGWMMTTLFAAGVSGLLRRDT